jgi:hypothetical protein
MFGCIQCIPDFRNSQCRPLKYRITSRKTQIHTLITSAIPAFKEIKNITQVRRNPIIENLVQKKTWIESFFHKWFKNTKFPSIALYFRISPEIINKTNTVIKRFSQLWLLKSAEHTEYTIRVILLTQLQSIYPYLATLICCARTRNKTEIIKKSVI